MRSIAKKVAWIWKDNQKEYLRRHSIQVVRDEERSIYFRKIKRKPLKQIEKNLNKLKNPADVRMDGR